MAVRLGAVFPQTESWLDPGAVRAFGEGVQELGFDHLMAYDHVLGADRDTHSHLLGPYRSEHMFHEILVLFGFLAAVAPELELVTGVVIAPQRQTALLAKQAVEIDILTRGKFRLGLGIGWNDVEYEALGMDFTNRGRRFDEQIELMRKLWSEPVFDFEGRWHTVTAAGINPLPERRSIPIWIGGSAERALRRAAQVADGLFPQRPLEGMDWAETLDVMRGWMREAGRDPDTFGLDQRISIADGASDEWRAIAEEWVGLGATHLTLVTMGAGFTTPDEHLERLRAGREALSGL
ncbi:MAG TPA: LLM class F420-dependent oxidoreductase [Gaiellaceae bacterium]|nr:LLM class F420-dependent oxidoreductase [Gaiellaceae bacterium]